MASTSLSAVAVLISGTAPDVGFVTASGDTATISGPSGGPLDFSRLVVRLVNEATGAGCTATLGAGNADFSGYSLGSYAVTVGTAASVVIGGKNFESTRFNTSAETLVITFTGGGGTTSTSIEAYQLPTGYTA